MNNVDRHQLIGQTLTTLAGGLLPFVTPVLNRVTPPGADRAKLQLRVICAVETAERVHKLKAAVASQSATSRPPSVQAKPKPEPERVSTADAPRTDVSAIADCSYAMAHYRIPVNDHIAVGNTGGDRQSASVEVVVVSAEGSHGVRAEIHLDLLAQQPTILPTVDLKLDPAPAWRDHEAGPIDIRVALENLNRATADDRNRVLGETERSMSLGSGPQLVAEWMIAVAWGCLCDTGELSRQELLNELNVKRSAYVCVGGEVFRGTHSVGEADGA